MAKITTMILGVIFLVLSGYVSASDIPCGEPKPPLKPYRTHTLTVWQDCEDLTWHVKAYQGKLKGVIYLSDLAVMDKDGVSATKSSKVTLNNGEMKATIDFDIYVPKPGMTKEFSFAVPLYARMVLVMNHGSSAHIRYGDIIDTSGIINLINPPDVEMHRVKVETR